MGKNGTDERDSREELITELEKLIREINEEGLLFLIKQANVLIYNQRVEMVNRRMRNVRSPGTPPQEQADEELQVVEKEGGQHFYIIIGGYHIYFTREEMRSLVRICHASDDEKDASGRLYRWFSRERKDLLVDGQVTGSADPRLALLYRHLVTTYRVKE